MHTVVARLREALEPSCRDGSPSGIILLSEGRYRINRAAHTWCDAAEFPHLIEQSRSPRVSGEDRRDLLARAAALYRGPFLDHSPPLPWVLGEADRFRRLALEALEALMALFGAADHWDAVERCANQALHVKGCHHPAIRASVVALAMRERVEEALAACERAMTSCACPTSDPDLPELGSLLRSENASVRALRTFLPGT